MTKLRYVALRCYVYIITTWWFAVAVKSGDSWSLALEPDFLAGRHVGSEEVTQANWVSDQSAYVKLFAMLYHYLMSSSLASTFGSWAKIEELKYTTFDLTNRA